MAIDLVFGGFRQRCRRMSAPVNMRATASFQFRGRLVVRGESFYTSPAEAVSVLRSGHAATVDEGDMRDLAAAAGIDVVRQRRIRGRIGGQA